MERNKKKNKENKSVLITVLRSLEYIWPYSVLVQSLVQKYQLYLLQLQKALLSGITPSNEIREAPKHIRPVQSEPTDHDSTCGLSRDPSPEVRD